MAIETILPQFELSYSIAKKIMIYFWYSHEHLHQSWRNFGANARANNSRQETKILDPLIPGLI